MGTPKKIDLEAKERFDRARHELEKFTLKYRPDGALIYKNTSLYWFVYPILHGWLQATIENLSSEEKISFTAEPTLKGRVRGFFKFSALLLLFFLEKIKNFLAPSPNENKKKILFVSPVINLQHLPSLKKGLVDTQIGFVKEKFETGKFQTKTIYMYKTKPLINFNFQQTSWFYYYVYFKLINLTKGRDEIESWETWLKYMSKRKLSLLEKAILTRLSEFDFGTELEKAKIAEFIISKEKPVLLITTNENGSSRPLVVAAQSSKIPVVGVQHGIIHQYHPQYIYPKDTTLKIPLVDKMTVFGDYSKRILTQDSSYRESQVVSTGQSRMDLTLTKYKNFSKDMFLEKMGISKSLKLIVVISQKGARNYLSAVLNNLKMKKDEFIFVKLHPAEKNDGFYDFLKNSWEENFLVTKDVDLYELLLASDVVVSAFSTVISEAIVFDRPAIQIRVAGIPEFINYSDYGVILEVGSGEELRDELSKVLYKGRKVGEKEREKFVKDHYYKLDALATDRI